MSRSGHAVLFMTLFMAAMLIGVSIFANSSAPLLPSYLKAFSAAWLGVQNNRKVQHMSFRRSRRLVFPFLRQGVISGKTWKALP